MGDFRLALSLTLKLQGGMLPSSPDEDEFISTITSAQNVSMLFSGGPQAFQSLIHHDIRKNKFCTRDLWDKIMSAIKVGSFGLSGQNA